MPTKTKEDEHKWQKAKEVAKEQGHSEDYAYIMGVYKKMKPDYFKEATVRVASRWMSKSAAVPIPANLVPTTSDGYELYDTPGADEAAKKLAAGITKALNELGKKISFSKSDSQNTAALRPVLKQVSDLMKPYGKFGIMDSEPRSVIRRIFRKYLNMLVDEYEAPDTFEVLEDWL